ncbi:tetratricopeptide repeat protein [Microcoleus sp. ZQ-A2]|nr:tetratricopeptide repeat protein [Microcoleus sp. FACHB-1]
MWLVAVFVCFGWILSVCIHEFGHALVAYLGGDTSVKEKGYLTLNPLKYTHPVYSLLLPILFLLMGGIALPGGAVYINRGRLRSHWWESAVSAAGPLASIVVTILLAIPFGLGWPTPSLQHWIWPSLAFLILLEIASILLNLLPIPPLDGYGIIEPWLPRKTQIQLNKFSQYGIWIIFALLWYVQPLNQLFWNWTYTISNFLGVPPQMASQGYDLFRQQSNILILGLVGCLWLFRRKELGWYNRGEKFRKSQRYEEAIAAYNQAIKIKPDYSEAWYAKASLLYQLQRYEEAVVAYDKVIQIQPEEAHAWFIRGWILGELQRYDQAIASYDKAIEIDENLDEAWFYRGKTLEKWKRYEDAIASYDQAIQIQPNYADAWYNKACCYTLLGNVSIAIETLQKAMGFNPERFREEAKTNSCFDAIRENQIFKQLVGM